MDEIVIGDKKYISSKQAAKATGYAKDYVGQLCREGRVPARLVGRSWYVLETAIQDHRFGEPRNGSIEPEKTATAHEMSPLQATWEAPRYEASKVDEVLPPINILREEATVLSAEEKDDAPEVAEQLQETWQAWFDRFENTAGMHKDDTIEEKIEDEVLEEESSENKEAIVPVHVVYKAEHQAPPLVEIPSAPAVMPASSIERWPAFSRTRHKRALVTIHVAGAVIAVITFITAVLGSGYLDSYILSSRQVSAIAGVVLYNK